MTKQISERKVARDGTAKQRERGRHGFPIILIGQANTTHTHAADPHGVLELEMREHTLRR